MSGLLVVAGEASGDRAAAAVLKHLKGAQVFGLGGPALRDAGATIIDDMRGWTALGIGEASRRVLRVIGAWRALGIAARARKPVAALLVNYTEFNTLLARRLHSAGVRVLWYGAPQIWAWRPRRAHSLRRSVDRMAVMLPFEEALWRAAGVDAHYVGHPALESPSLDWEAARRALRMTPFAAAVAILPGSRPHEVRSLLLPMLEGYERVRAERASVDARVLVAGSLDEATRAWAMAQCSAHRVPVFEVDPSTGATMVLRAFDATLCASGTASLEATLARAVPVIAYRVGLTTEVAARAFLRTPHVALPNVLLGRRAFPELLQRDVRASRIAAALAEVLDDRSRLLAACTEVETLFDAERNPSAKIALMLEPWLRSGAA